MVRHARQHLQHRLPSLGHAAAVALAVTLVALAGPAGAAKVYRCGNVFQDQPCPEVKVVAAVPIERPAAPTECAKDASARGDCVPRPTRDAQRVVAADAKR